MRIALLTDGIFPYVVGGMQKHSYHLAKQLAQNNHTVYLFHCNESTYDANKLEFFTAEERKNIRSFVIPFPHKRYYPLHYITESRQYSGAIYDALLPLLSETDFIFVQGFCGWELLNRKDDKTPPVAVHFHGYEMYQQIPTLKSKLSSFFLRNAVQENLNSTDYTISFGGKITSILKQLVPAKKIWEVPGGIEQEWITESIKPIEDKVKFVFLGRYERRKGIPELNKTIKELLPNNNFTFDFIGDIPEEHKINSALLRYHGKLSSEAEIKKILSQCDILVSPSYAEGLPISIMEAMAQGLAIIATDVGSVSTLVDSSNGWLLPTPFPEVIAVAMRSAIREKDKLQSKKESSVKKIKEGFLLESATNKLIGLMEQHIKR
jgi:glycosyltransferase involved in cell wall biosynthesis